MAQENYEGQRKVITGRAVGSYSWGTLTTLASSGTYLYVALQAVAGRITLGDISLYTQAATSVQSSFTGLLNGVNGLYEGNHYLFRLYDPTAGQVRIDGHDIRDYDPVALRAQMVAVFQDHSQCQMTARENVGLGRLDHINDLTAVASAAEQDEHDLFQRLRALAAGRTTIFISHRFSTVRRADRILVLEDGLLIEQGTHDQLMALGGRYAHLFTLQAAAYVGNGIEVESVAAQ